MTTASTSAPIRVLIVDDHPMVRDGINGLLTRQDDMEAVGEASDGAEAVDKFRELAPDVTLMDVQMQGMGGVEAIEKIRGLSAEARILVLTTYPGDASAVRAIRAGASGYLLKNCVRGELIDAIRSVHAGRRVVCSDIAHALAEHALDTPLTEREIAILKLVAEGHQNKQIAWQLTLSVDTIKAQLKTIFEKLGVHDRTHAVTVATRRGYLDR
ncbi:response regulator [Sphingomonas kyeonggiensis]|uniref:DNA-binding NarL/FixJ family response regulator n=1 Tax=Sphingomonas kyeonggiensis TaxID=1268553 RepID=A0A7W6NYG6_9SPHN|nr:response regulator transcription factor [Sphingomonas kyeonggiensis]MBB4100657.1 DNA-binding NarL/FixJ family response regulator [Sphingomonas kyeonggiensis]